MFLKITFVARLNNRFEHVLLKVRLLQHNIFANYLQQFPKLHLTLYSGKMHNMTPERSYIGIPGSEVTAVTQMY